ncbi:MAG: hypothetical protein AAGD96_18755, partial [Chloroflexota bacterium]
MSSNNNEPKPLDWTVAAGFVIFMISMITAIFTQNLRILGFAFVAMPVVIGIGLFNNVKNMQPDWGDEENGDQIVVPDAPDS